MDIQMSQMLLCQMLCFLSVATYKSTSAAHHFCVELDIEKIQRRVLPQHCDRQPLQLCC